MCASRASARSTTATSSAWAARTCASRRRERSATQHPQLRAPRAPLPVLRPCAVGRLERGARSAARRAGRRSGRRTRRHCAGPATRRAGDAARAEQGRCEPSVARRTGWSCCEPKVRKGAAYPIAGEITLGRAPQLRHRAPRRHVRLAAARPCVPARRQPCGWRTSAAPTARTSTARRLTAPTQLAIGDRVQIGSTIFEAQ